MSEIHLDPKKRFASHPQKKQFEEFVGSEVFLAAAEAAMNIANAKLPLATSVKGAAANHYRSLGARGFLAELMNLTTTPAEPPKRSSVNLKQS